MKPIYLHVPIFVILANIFMFSVGAGASLTTADDRSSDSINGRAVIEASRKLKRLGVEVTPELVSEINKGLQELKLQLHSSSIVADISGATVPSFSLRCFQIHADANVIVGPYLGVAVCTNLSTTRVLVFGPIQAGGVGVLVGVGFPKLTYYGSDLPSGDYNCESFHLGFVIGNGGLRCGYVNPQNSWIDLGIGFQLEGWEISFGGSFAAWAPVKIL